MDGTYIVVDQWSREITRAMFFSPLKLKRGQRVSFRAKNFVSDFCIAIDCSKKRPIIYQSKNCKATLISTQIPGKHEFVYEVTVIGDDLEMVGKMINWIEENLCPPVVIDFDEKRKI